VAGDKVLKLRAEGTGGSKEFGAGSLELEAKAIAKFELLKMRRIGRADVSW